MNTRKLFEWGGIAAGILLIIFGAASLFLSVNGRSDVRSSLQREQIVGTPDMTPTAIAASAKEAGLPASTALPTCSVANKAIDSGSRAKCFADYMRIHALEATDGQTYAQMGRFLDASGKPTSDQAQAAKDPKSGQLVENPQRNLWVTETALATALTMGYLAENVATFGIVVGIALLLTGIGFLVLALAGALRHEKRVEKVSAKAVPA
jgi:uncharacterized iron-regulated membrane protein